jgi:hypothetical protein
MLTRRAIPLPNQRAASIDARHGSQLDVRSEWRWARQRDASPVNVVDRHGGNGLALKILGETIRLVFGSDVGPGRMV